MKLPQAPGWLALALLLSLGGNAFFGGYLFGRGQPFAPPGGPPPFGFPGGPPPGGPPPGPEHFINRLADKLPPADAAVLRAFIDENKEFFTVEDRRRHEFPRRLRGALTADPFDVAAFERVLAEHDEAEYASHVRLRGALAKAASALSLEARRKLMELGPPGGPPPGPPPPR